MLTMLTIGSCCFINYVPDKWEKKKLKVRCDERMKINGFISNETNCFPVWKLMVRRRVENVIGFIWLT